MRVAVLMLWLLLFPTGAKPPTPLTLKVYPKVSVSVPARIRLTTRVEPNPDNREICVDVTSADFEAHGCRDTDQAPITIDWEWWMPAGAYQAVARLRTVHTTETRAAVTFRVGVESDDSQDDPQ